LAYRTLKDKYTPAEGMPSGWKLTGQFVEEPRLEFHVHYLIVPNERAKGVNQIDHHQVGGEQTSAQIEIVPFNARHHQKGDRKCRAEEFQANAHLSTDNL
jgi:hypothetical protein